MDDNLIRPLAVLDVEVRTCKQNNHQSIADSADLESDDFFGSDEKEGLFKRTKKGVPKAPAPKSESEDDAVDENMDFDDFFGSDNQLEEDAPEKEPILEKPKESISDGSYDYSYSYSYSDYSYGYSDYSYSDDEANMDSESKPKPEENPTAS